MALTKEAILAAQDLQTREVQVPEWGGSVLVKMMTGTQRDAMSASLRKDDGTFDPTHYREKLLAASIVGDDGSFLFTDADVPALAEKSDAAINRVFKVAEELNGTGQGAVEAAAKN